jgi:hypothetical protein
MGLADLPACHHPPLPYADKIASFAHWLGGVLLGHDGSWVTPLSARP